MNLRFSTHRAFTLIELLVVITIIAVLAGLLLPVTGKVMENARKTSARSTEAQIVSAVNQYQTEYGSYPVPSTAVATNDFTYDDSPTNHNGILFQVLRALNTSDPSNTTTASLNTRKIVYFEMKDVKNTTTPKDGFILTGTPKTANGKQLAAGDLVDPWGNMYFIRMDSNYTNALKNPYSNPKQSDDSDDQTTQTANDQTVLRTGVISYCWGADGLPGNKNTVGTSPWAAAQGDDVTSWQ